MSNEGWTISALIFRRSIAPRKSSWRRGSPKWRFSVVEEQLFHDEQQQLCFTTASTSDQWTIWTKSIYSNSTPTTWRWHRGSCGVSASNSTSSIRPSSSAWHWIHHQATSLTAMYCPISFIIEVFATRNWLNVQQIRRISAAARAKFGIGGGGQLDTNGFPSIYLSGISPSEIGALNVQQIRVLLPRLTLIADHMNMAQLASIYIKVSFNPWINQP